MRGATWFFTLTLQDRRSELLTRRIDLVRAAYATVLRKHPFHTHAFVVLPNHLHAVITLPDNDAAYARRWALFKSTVSHSLPANPRTLSQSKRREKGIWQRRFWEHLIRDENDLKNHIAYCWANPVKHGLCDQPNDWPYSTFHRDQKHGLVPPEWHVPTQESGFGEFTISKP